MKLDGHAKLTNSAVRTFKTQCSKATKIVLRKNICNMPQFSTLNIAWSNERASNAIDNSNLAKWLILQELSIFGESLHQLNHGYLTREVIAVDIEPLKLKHHVLDSGQKYHFMRRASSTSIKKAHAEIVNFIRGNAEKWVKEMNRVLYAHRRHGRSGSSTTFLRKRAASSLALSLHSLQDSFSPAHTKRIHFSAPKYPGAIIDIFVYNQKNKHNHSSLDYKSGSLKSLNAKAAVYASADLMRLCVSAVAIQSSKLKGWHTFQNRWLKLSSKAK